jgi:hypothetical protein
LERGLDLFKIIKYIKSLVRCQIYLSLHLLYISNRCLIKCQSIKSMSKLSITVSNNFMGSINLTIHLRILVNCLNTILIIKDSFMDVRHNIYIRLGSECTLTIIPNQVHSEKGATHNAQLLYTSRYLLLYKINHHY